MGEVIQFPVRHLVKTINTGSLDVTDVIELCIDNESDLDNNHYTLWDGLPCDVCPEAAQ